MGWAEWKKDQALQRRLDLELRRLKADVEYLESTILEAWAEGDRRMAAKLNTNPRWRKTVDFFLNERIYRKTSGMPAWREACGTDGRLWKETRGLGWTRLWRVLLMSRRMRRG